MKRVFSLIVIGCIGFCVFTATAQTLPPPKSSVATPAPKTPPTLTTEQKQNFTILLQRIKIDQLESERIQHDFDQARGEVEALVESLKVDGYDLKLDTMTYTPKVVK